MREPELDELYARLLSEAGALLFGRFRLHSGAESPVYVDMRRLLGSPRAFRAVLSGLGLLLAQRGYPDALVGVATGGIAWATGLGLLHGLPVGYVRPRPKDHGAGRLVEGVEPPARVYLVDDVATTGSSLAASVEALRSSGFQVEAALVVVDREQGAARRLAELGVELLSLTTLRRLLAASARLGLLTPERMEEIIRQLYPEPQ